MRSLKYFNFCFFFSGISQSSQLHSNGLRGGNSFGGKMGGASMSAMSGSPAPAALEKSASYLSQTGLEERPPPPSIYPSSTFSRDNNSSCVSTTAAQKSKDVRHTLGPVSISFKLSCSTSLPLVSTRWVRMTLSLYSLF